MLSAGMKVVADFWEDHCVECGEPACFASCPKFRRGAHGRCERVVFLPGGAVRFGEWGKLELVWHGRLACPETVAKLKAWNAKREPILRFLQRMLQWLPLPYGRGPYGIFRSLRWRKAQRMAEFAEPPRRWVIEAFSETPVSLTFEVRNAALDLLMSRTALIEDGRLSLDMELPEVAEGALFSVRPTGGGKTGELRFARNELVSASPDATNAAIKCVAWDLDGVVWKGTLSEGDAVELDMSVLYAVRKLDEQGIVSSICSKNDEAAALARLRELGIEEWFVFPQINWGPKSESLKRLAGEMNIGLGSIAFVDDREENRGEVREKLPQVRVFAETEIATLLSQCGCDGVSDIVAGTLGRGRRLMYRDEMARRSAAKDFAGDAAAFSAASGLDFELLPVEGECVARCLELVQRTNQLNLTGRRYDAASFDELLKTTESRAVRVWDKYGDYGIVGFVAWRGTHLVECCFSCRVAKRGVERRVLDKIAGGKKFTADVVVTERNAPIREIVGEWMK